MKLKWVADPNSDYPNPDTTFENKPDPDPTLSKKPTYIKAFLSQCFMVKVAIKFEILLAILSL